MLWFWSTHTLSFCARFFSIHIWWKTEPQQNIVIKSGSDCAVCLSKIWFLQIKHFKRFIFEFINALSGCKFVYFKLFWFRFRTNVRFSSVQPHNAIYKVIWLVVVHNGENGFAGGTLGSSVHSLFDIYILRALSITNVTFVELFFQMYLWFY